MVAAQMKTERSTDGAESLITSAYLGEILSIGGSVVTLKDK